MGVQMGQYPPALRTIIHLSDTHFLAGGAALHGTLPTERNLAQALQQIERMRVQPDALIFTGDLTDLGQADAYLRLRGLLEPVVDRLDCELILLMGNHDERAPMREHLWLNDRRGHRLRNEPARSQHSSNDHPLDAVWDLDGLRVIGLDTSVPGWHHGDLSADQLEWLATELAEPAPLGTILALHHPPVPSTLPLFDVLELRDQQRLADVLRGSDVRSILGGHLHYSTHTTFAGIPVAVAAASCYTMNLSLPAREANGMNGGQSFHLVSVYEDTVAHAVVPLGDFPTGDVFSEEFIRELEHLSASERLDRFSRKPAQSAHASGGSDARNDSDQRRETSTT